MKLRTMKKLILITLLILLGISASAVYHVAMAKGTDNETIYAGVYLDGVYVGGLTKEEAMEEYDEYIDGIEELELTITTIQGSFTTTLDEIGVSVSVENAVETAYNYGRQGNILSRYKEIKSLEEESVVLVPEKDFDAETLRDKLINETSDMVKEPKNASIARVDGAFIVYPGETGVVIQVDDTVALLEDIFEDEWRQQDITLKAVVEEQEPEYTEEDFYAIDSVLGDAKTNYNSWNVARSQNLATGASKISGTVLMPGEQFSMYETVSPFTEENGYANAGQYVSNGEELELVDGLGGGICQVSTTLYNAVLEAELAVNERYPHSLTVSYANLGMDAAIAGDYMDFKFTNSTEYPIYIEGYTADGSIYFNIFGHETRPANRKIEFESKIIETYEPGEPEEIKDPELEKGEEETEQEAYTGYYVELWKHVYVDGVEVECVLVDYGRSKYNAQAAKIRIGTKKKDKDKDKDKDKNKNNKDSTETDGSTEEPTETPTEAPTEAPTEETTEAPEETPTEPSGGE